jgi:hypothetical protein
MRALFWTTSSFGLLWVSGWLFASQAAADGQPDPVVLVTLATTLPAQPTAFGPPSSERKAWDPIRGGAPTGEGERRGPVPRPYQGRETPAKRRLSRRSGHARPNAARGGRPLAQGLDRQAHVPPHQPGRQAHREAAGRARVLLDLLPDFAIWSLVTCALACSAVTAEPPQATGLPAASPVLESAAKAFSEGRFEVAHDGFEAIVRDPAALPFVRGLAWCGLAKLAAEGQPASELHGLRERLIADPAVPAGYREAALRQSTPPKRVQPPTTERTPATDRVRLPELAATAVAFHVANSGNDADDGSEARPFHSLTRARDALRTLRQKHAGRLPPGGVRVIVGGGTYPLRETITLEAEDSGEADAPVVYQAKRGETPVFDGGVRVTNWKTIADAAVRERLAATVRDRVLVADLKELGVTNYGEATALRRRPELFADGAPQTLARWPNEGFAKTGEILGRDTFKVWNSINGCRDGKFRYVEDRAGTWLDEPDVRLYGYWFWDWYEEYQTVAQIDAAERSYTLAQPYSQYGYRQGQRYYALNVFRELDRPGEWYLDRQAGKAYWLSPDGLDATNAELVLSVLAQPFVVLQEAKHVLLLGLTFQNARADGIHINGGADCLVAACTIRRLGGDGVVIQGGQHHGLFGCRLETLGCGGARVAGGDRQTLEPGQHFVENCTVADISRLKRTYTPAVHLDGCGHRLARNLFERMPSSALRIEGNDHLIELNVIREVVQESDDQGGVDLFGNPLYRGVVLRWNRWCDIRGGTHNGAAGVRLDDMISGVVVQGNVFERCGAVAFGGVQIHGGKDNWIDGNVFLECFAGISFSRWGEKRWLESIEKFLPQTAAPAFAARYPELARIKTGADVNFLSRNLFVRCGKTFLRDGGVPRSALNAVVDQPFELKQVATDGGQAEATALRALLFEPIPVSQMGPYAHPWRVLGP